jgi:hypothetical protein
MKLSYYFLVIIIFSFTDCSGQTNSDDQSAAFVDSNKRFKREIPSIDIFYNLAKTKQKQLGLDSLENGFDVLQVRVWYDFALVQERKLIIITHKDTGWAATVYDLQVDWDGKTETILSKTIRQVTPISGWEAFSKKLLDLKILTLPNEDDIAGYVEGDDGRTYNVEIATKSHYRFYGYWEPQTFQDRFWQAKNMADILKLFETELGVR